jgi:hypothetical protein
MLIVFKSTVHFAVAPHMIAGGDAVDPVRVEAGRYFSRYSESSRCIFTVDNDEIDVMFLNEAGEGEKESLSSRFTDDISDESYDQLAVIHM